MVKNRSPCSNVQPNSESRCGMNGHGCHGHNCWTNSAIIYLYAFCKIAKAKYVTRRKGREGKTYIYINCNFCNNYQLTGWLIHTHSFFSGKRTVGCNDGFAVRRHFFTVTLLDDLPIWIPSIHSDGQVSVFFLLLFFFCGNVVTVISPGQRNTDAYCV